MALANAKSFIDLELPVKDWLYIGHTFWSSFLRKNQLPIPQESHKSHVLANLLIHIYWKKQMIKIPACVTPGMIVKALPCFHYMNMHIFSINPIHS